MRAEGVPNTAGVPASVDYLQRRGGENYVTSSVGPREAGQDGFLFP